MSFPVVESGGGATFTSNLNTSLHLFFDNSSNFNTFSRTFLKICKMSLKRGGISSKRGQNMCGIYSTRRGN